MYKRMSRHATPEERFRAKFIRGTPEECWPYLGKIHKKYGYGLFFLDGKEVRAHRYAYALEHGSTPGDADVLHSCHNRACVNPNHLRLGTNQENVNDRIVAGRAVGKPSSTSDEHIQLVESSPDLSLRELARITGLSSAWCRKIRMGWRPKYPQAARS